MKKIFLLISTCISFNYLNAQTCAGTINMPVSGSCTVGSTAVTFADNGGTGGSTTDNTAGNYANTTARTYTICPLTAGNKVRVTFSTFAVESCCDEFYIYNGTGTGGTLLGTYMATMPPVTTSTAADGCLTFYFTPDGSINSTGWVSSVVQVPAPPQGSNTCATLTKLCSVNGQTLTFGATVGAADASTTNPSNNYGCLGSSPRPSWFYIQMETTGTIDLTLQGYSTTNTVVDNDFALWGPFASVAAAQAACNSYGTPLDCSYASGTGSESVNITGTAGQVYVLLVTAYSSSSSSFTLNQLNTSTGTTNCSGVAGACDISNTTLANISACNNNGTTSGTDDYYTADVTVTFANKPATGNLQITGTGIHSGAYSVAVGSTSTATTHVFTGVKIKADGSTQSIKAEFSALLGCNMTLSGIAAVNSCSCAAGVMTLGVTTP